MSLLFFIISYSGLFLITIFLGLLVYMERKKAFDREQRYVNALLAKDLDDLAQNQENVLSTPKDRKDITKLENELAIHAENTAREHNKSAGIPI